MVRLKIYLNTNKDVVKFIEMMNNEGSLDKYIITDLNNTYCVGARSYLGVLYASFEFGDEMYLINLSEDGKFPSFINQFQSPT